MLGPRVRGWAGGSQDLSTDTTAPQAQRSEPLAVNWQAWAEPGDTIPSRKPWRQFLKILQILFFSPVKWG